MFTIIAHDTYTVPLPERCAPHPWEPAPGEQPGPTFDLYDMWDGTFDRADPPGPTFNL